MNINLKSKILGYIKIALLEIFLRFLEGRKISMYFEQGV